MEGVFGVDCEAGDFGGEDGLGAVARGRVIGDRAGFGAVAEEAKGAEGGCCEGELVPFEDDGSLGSVAAAEDWGGGRGETVG